MRVLFFMRSTVYARNFESTLRLLAERGHQVHVVAEPHHQVDRTDLVGRLCAQYPGITHGLPPAAPPAKWSRTGYELRRGLDYLRYLEPEYAAAPKLRRRAELKAPSFLTTPRAVRLTSDATGRRLTARMLRAADRALPRDPRIDEFVRAHRPDLVALTPLVEPGSPQSTFVRAARALGVPAALCVYSWDNLTNKGLIHDQLDVVTVWNEAMRREAVALHRVPPDRVVVTGAPAYDHWFSWAPRDTRDEFCARVGLDPSQPYVLYLCSSKFIAPDELPFIARWIRDVRGASSRLRAAGVLIRPHPQNVKDWSDERLAGLHNVAVWPRDGGNPADADSRAEYYDSIFHSAAVVGVNTSAQIESAIVGRGVFTLLAPEFAETQEGTLHFRHLQHVNGGLLTAATSIGEHAAHLEAAIADPGRTAEQCRRFVEAFVRPFGLGEAATPRLVAALEATAKRGVETAGRPVWEAAVGPALRRAAAALTAHPAPAPRGATASRAGGSPARRTVAAHQPAPNAYQLYLEARRHVAIIRAAEPVSEASAAERDELMALEPLWTADPQDVDSLRLHAAALGQAKQSDYADDAIVATRRRLDRTLRRLFKMGDRRLWIDEPEALGTFGAGERGGRYNDDTLRFFQVLSLLQDAAVLRLFGGAERRTVWEIGGGWGGFAYRFKRVCPNSTYLITAAPTVLLASAVYLMTLFPDARFRFFDPARPDAFWEGWGTVDFAFAPESRVTSLRPPALDLTVDLGTLDRMTAARASAHVERAHATLASYFLAICPSASAVRATVERLYWPHPVSTPVYLDRRLGVAADTTFLLGWRRLHA